jgi:peroxiredoxin
MKDELALGKPAPDFKINDLDGRPIRLSDYHGRKNVVLAFLRGFM